VFVYKKKTSFQKKYFDPFIPFHETSKKNWKFGVKKDLERGSGKKKRKKKKWFFREKNRGEEMNRKERKNFFLTKWTSL